MQTTQTVPDTPQNSARLPCATRTTTQDFVDDERRRLGRVDDDRAAAEIVLVDRLVPRELFGKD
jgi:hypothetical protein